jgi:hypothetical protein
MNPSSTLSLEIHPSSVLANIKPQWVMYNDLVVTSKRYMREVSAIKPEWIFEVASHHFTDRRKEIHLESYMQATTALVKSTNEDQFTQEFNVRLGKRLHKQTGLSIPKPIL